MVLVLILGSLTEGALVGQDRGCMSIGLRLSPEEIFQDSPWLSATLSSRHLPALALLFPPSLGDRAPLKGPG